MVKECTSIHFSKELYEFLAHVEILVKRSDIFEKQILILLRRCDAKVDQP